MTNTTRTNFNSASEAFDYWYWKIYRDGIDFAGTKAMFNVGFYIDKPQNNYIANEKRGWSQEYAEAEWQWYLISMLRDNPDTRQAAISIYDAKEINLYDNDTPCTYAVQFTVVDNKLNMSVVMRSNDIWYGFCNDQYCFSKLQMLVAEETGYKLGSYYHFAHNLHIYNDKLPTRKSRLYHL